MSPFTRKAKLKLLFTYTQRHIHRMHVFPEIPILQSVFHLADTIHALLASGDLILEEKHFMIPISTHIHKSMNTCKTLLRHTAHHKKQTNKEINTMHSCVQRHTYAYRNTSSISNSENSLRRKHLIQTSRWMDMHYVVQNGFFDMV